MNGDGKGAGKRQESRVGRSVGSIHQSPAFLLIHSFIQERTGKEEGRKKKEKERTIDQHIGERIDAVHHHQRYQSSFSSVGTLFFSTPSYTILLSMINELASALSLIVARSAIASPPPPPLLLSLHVSNSYPPLHRAGG